MLETFDDDLNILNCDGIDTSEGFVQKDERWTGSKSPSDLHAAAFAAIVSSGFEFIGYQLSHRERITSLAWL